MAQCQVEWDREKLGHAKHLMLFYLSLSAQRILSGHPLNVSRPAGLEKELNKYTNVIRGIM